MARDASPRRALVAIVVAAVVLAAGTFALGRFTSPAQPTPSTTSAEAGFARDMQTHHQQAVELSMLVRDRTDDPDVRLLAYDIALAQQQQSGQLYGWLTQWGLPQVSPEPSMTWMSRPPLDSASGGHGHAAADTPGATMPGMATPEQIAQLTAARGADAERLFLELMIAHHEGGIEMAEALVERSNEPNVTAFARGILSSQSAEIEAMTAMLAARG
jgi:uncharacterized protein (DUF305 family)